MKTTPLSTALFLAAFACPVAGQIIINPAGDLAQPPETPPSVPWNAGGPPSMTARLRTNRVGPLRGVNLATGECFEECVDLRIPGRGLDLVWARRYRSRRSQDSPMGVGWTHSYDVSVVADGNDLELRCWGRHDLFEHGMDGIFRRAEFFLEGEEELDGTYTFTFPDGGTWRFHALDGAPEEGKLSAIVDRHGNTLTLAYDGQGRLETITDTLGRDVDLAYDADGRVASVTDFSGRSVVYAYWQDGDAGGSAGDLRSARSPVVTGTPNGNDFPLGKSTVYTYSKGLGDARLDHNLLTVTNPKGQVFVRNFYAPGPPTSLAFDRLVRQDWGDPGERIDVRYEHRPRGPGGVAAAGTLAIVNDRVGNVSEYEFDQRNRLEAWRRYAGRAVPVLPTTSAFNRPGGKLRASDPDFFETRFDWNGDSLCTRITYPEGNQVRLVYQSQLVPAATTRTRGNLRRIVRLPGPRGGDQPALVERFTYQPASNLVATHVDPRGATTTYTRSPANGDLLHVTHRIPSAVEDFEYNAFGQLTAHVLPDDGSGNRRRDELTYHTLGPQRGYLKDVIVDAPNLALTTSYGYDAVGHVVSVTDPRGADELRIVNALGQVVRTRSREALLGGMPVRYERDFSYDANDNLVQLDVRNVRDDGSLDPNPDLTTTYEYDVLDRLTRVIREADAGHDVTNELEYDANRNLTLIRRGEATNGNDDHDVLGLFYDERDLPFRTVGAPGDLADQSTTQFDYDRNGNRVAVLEGLEDGPHMTSWTLDGYDRPVLRTDPMGNVTHLGYDPNSNRVLTLVEGELVDVPGQADNVRLAELHATFDALDRLVQQDRMHFDPATQAPIGDGIARTTFAWSDASLLLELTDDNAHSTTWAWDSAYRPASRTDAAGNEVAWARDANSNVTGATRTERSDLGNPDQVFTTTYVYDPLDRRIREIDSLGSQTERGYDSRGFAVRVQDSLGNETRRAWDGLGRLILTVRDLDMDGADALDPDDVVLPLLWDDSSRLAMRTDARGNPTTFGYDSRGLCTSVMLADGTGETFSYDAHGRCVLHVDADGTTVSDDHDALHRRTSRTVVPGPGVASTTTQESFEYDGLGRLASAANDAATVLLEYDSLDSLTSEERDGKATSASHDGLGNPLQVVYPGGRTIERTYDDLERVASVSDTSPMTIASALWYVGPGRLERCDLGNGTRLELVHDGITGVPNPAGDFGVARVIESTHTLVMGGSVIDHRAYGWDRTQRRLLRDDLLPTGPQLLQELEYDPLHRLTGSTVTPAVGPVVATNYALDKAGNRTLVTGGDDPGAYTMDATLPVPGDAQVDQYTTTSFDARTYDDRGNLASVDAGLVSERLLSWDYANRLVEVQDAASGMRHTYAYDALGRRITKVVDADGTPETTHFYYRGRSVVEEHDGADAVTATYVGTDARASSASDGYIGETEKQTDRFVLLPGLLTMRRGGTDSFFHVDDLGSVVALTDGNGTVVERLDYGDFGSTRVMDAAHAPLAGTQVGNPYAFRGMRLDPETGLLHADGDARLLDPRAGRYVVIVPGDGPCVPDTPDAPGVLMDGEYHIVPGPDGPWWLTLAASTRSPIRNRWLQDPVGDRAPKSLPTAGFSGVGPVSSAGRLGVISVPYDFLVAGPRPVPLRFNPDPGDDGFFLGVASSSGAGRTAYASDDPWSHPSSSGSCASTTTRLLLPVGLGVVSLEDGCWIDGLTPLPGAGSWPRVESIDRDDPLASGRGASTSGSPAGFRRTGLLLPVGLGVVSLEDGCWIDGVY